MNRSRFIFNYIFRGPNGKGFNWRFYFPLIGVILGTTIALLTLGIMEGMEAQIFTKLKTVNIASKIPFSNAIHSKIDDAHLGTSQNIIIKNNEDYRIIEMRSFDKFEYFIRNNIKPYLISEVNRSYNSKYIYIGSDLASKIQCVVGDTVLLTSPLDVNIFSGIPPIKDVIIGGIFNIQLLNYDSNIIFSSIDIAKSILKKPVYWSFSNKDKKELLKIDNSLNIFSWENAHEDFISAMKLEKIVFSSFGFLIILLSAFSAFSIMCISVVKRISEIGILRAMGISNNFIFKIYIIKSISIGLLGAISGVFIFYIIAALNNQHGLINSLFADSILFDFKILPSIEYSILTVVFSIFVLIVSGIYPAMFSTSIQIKDSINYNK
jgi:lipoprotein-releasing system permease protein